LFGIIAINFVVVQMAPGGPVEQEIAQLKGHGGSMGLGGSASEAAMPSAGLYRGEQGIDPHVLAEMRHMFGFDKPPLTRFLLMLKGYLTLDLGRSFFLGQSVWSLIIQRVPVSVSLGLWSTLLIYMVSIPLGIAKATRDGTRFDLATSLSFWLAMPFRGFSSPSCSSSCSPAARSSSGFRCAG
jgi:microcin C transport system permease protein